MSDAHRTSLRTFCAYFQKVRRTPLRSIQLLNFHVSKQENLSAELSARKESKTAFFALTTQA